MTVCGTSIPLVIRFGAEKGRVLILAAVFIPAAILGGSYLVFTAARGALTNRLATLLLAASSLAALAWCAAMYAISCRVYERKEF